MGTVITAKAVFVAPTSTAPDTLRATVQALTPGDYVLQLSEGWGHKEQPWSFRRRGPCHQKPLARVNPRQQRPPAITRIPIQA